jgi:hypothetical protein
MVDMRDVKEARPSTKAANAARRLAMKRAAAEQANRRAGAFGLYTAFARERCPYRRFMKAVGLGRFLAK